jgi:RNA polymerase sigma-70 factor (ECF subfamily)
VAAEDWRDRQLLERIVEGDERALARLYDRHKESLYRYVVHLVDSDGAEDVLQETLLATWRGAAGFRARSSVRTWMFAIARNQALLLTRKRLPEPSASLGDLADAEEPGPEEAVVAMLDAALVARAVEALRPVHREILHLACVQGLSGAEMSEVLGVPVGTVKSRLHNAKRELAERLSHPSPSKW